jgi:maltooligosyltrehalose trehalohydrolase
LKHRHRLPFGAEITPDGVEFRLWAPAAEAVAVELADGALVPMRRDADDIFSVATDKARAGTRYRYRIGGQSYPDPASRFQPEGAMGPSEVIDPTAYEWRDQEWHGRPWEETVLYELHVGAFSEAGDYDGVAAHLDHLAALGVTAIELMPLADCPGRWNWGYDGVLLYAPASRYGRPDDLKRLVEAAHMVGIAVILDVVYNHLGPEGNFLPAYAPLFFTDKHVTPWGAAVNFDDRGARHVRDFAIQNAHYWLEEFHLDGLRLDAVDQIRDDSHPHILVELGEAVRQAITDRPIHLMLENYDNRASLIGAGRGGPGPHTAQWNDDFHHVHARAATGADPWLL